MARCTMSCSLSMGLRILVTAGAGMVAAELIELRSTERRAVDCGGGWTADPTAQDGRECRALEGGRPLPGQSTAVRSVDWSPQLPVSLLLVVAPTLIMAQRW